VKVYWLQQFMIPNELKRQQPTITPQTPPVWEVSQGQKFTVDVNIFQSLLLLIVPSTEAEILWSQI
jgi:hypothetical protein